MEEVWVNFGCAIRDDEKETERTRERGELESHELLISSYMSTEGLVRENCLSLSFCLVTIPTFFCLVC